MQGKIKSNRVEWIDLCKFIGIFYMVWAHSGDSTLMDQYIHIFHMPIFFFLSGYVFKISSTSKSREFFFKKAKAILVPYFAFAIIVYYAWWVFYKIINEAIPVSFSELLHSIFSYNTILSPFSGVQWYLTCLFLVEIMFFMILKAMKPSKNTIAVILILFSIVGYFFGKLDGIRLVWGLDTGFTGIVFFGMGYLFKNINSSKFTKMIYSPKLKLILALLILSLGTGFMNSTVNLRTIKYGNYFLFYLSAITSIAMYIAISIYIGNTKMKSTKLYKCFMYIGQNSIVVLVLNQLYIQMLKKTQIYQVIELNTNLKGLICAIIVLIIMLPTIFIINRYIPVVVGKKSVRKKYLE